MRRLILSLSKDGASQDWPALFCRNHIIHTQEKV
jgi:hypothetical protein